MGAISKTKTLLFVTSPRSPEKLIPEIKLLDDSFSGHEWYETTQAKFYHLLVDQDFFDVTNRRSKDPAFSARDRINRAPQMLGFVDLKPFIRLTQPGKLFAYSVRPQDALLKQLLKYQLPSPYQRPSKKLGHVFWCRPYLEILRLVRHFGSITFDEIKIFGLQLTDYRRFDEIVQKIELFRIEKACKVGSYRKYAEEVFDRETREIYASDLAKGQYGVRESYVRSEKNFLETKKRNARDYADALFRYLSFTGVIKISQSGHSMKIATEREEDVDFILESVSRDPVFVDDRNSYKEYLFDASIPVLRTDDERVLRGEVSRLDSRIDVESMSFFELKEMRDALLASKKNALIESKISNIKAMRDFDSIIEVFQRIENKEYYDNPLMFEWNTWRAMTMLDGGEIVANFSFDDDGNPLSTAAGNKPDILCDYGDFLLNVEVTLQGGQKQYDNEGEPVARHLGKVKCEQGKDAYCLFIAPKVSEATIAHFYYLQHVFVRHYGGYALVVPLNLSSFKKMVVDISRLSYKPDASKIKNFIKEIEGLRGIVDDEIEWFEKTQLAAVTWLSGGK